MSSINLKKRINNTAQQQFAIKLKTWFLKDFLTLKTMEAFILAYKLAGYVKNCLEVVKTDVCRGFCPTPNPNTVIYALIMHLSNTWVQFSIEKYFRAVFDKLKKN